MTRLFGLLALLCAGLLALPASAQTFDEPQALLEFAYSAYETGEFPENDRVLYSERIKDLFQADAERAAGEMGALSFDPFINAQEEELTAYAIGEPVARDDAVVIEVRYTNVGLEQTNRFTLVEERDGWKIDEIENVSPDGGWRLSEILAADPLLN